MTIEALPSWTIFWNIKQISSLLKKIQVTQSIFSDHKVIKLKINTRKYIYKAQQIFKRLDHTFQNIPWVKEETKMKFKYENEYVLNYNI